MKYKIQKANAEYTGGSVYIFTGKLTNGNYFFATNDNGDVRILNADPDEPCDLFSSVWENIVWQEKHLVEDLDNEKEKAAFIVEICNHILQNKPEGNYAEGDIKAIKNRFYNKVDNKSAREIIDERKKDLTNEEIVEHLKGLIEWSKECYYNNTNYPNSPNVNEKNVLDYPYDGDGELGTVYEDAWFKDIIVYEKVIEILKSNK